MRSLLGVEDRRPDEYLWPVVENVCDAYGCPVRVGVGQREMLTMATHPGLLLNDVRLVGEVLV